MEPGAAAGGGPDGPRARRGLGDAERPQQNHQVRPQAAADRLPKHSYWLDLWLFVLVDLVLFLLVYLWP
uniref:HCV F-transactivated protein 1 n=1 Tax=Molossus molossus TaxID=27622 RepID=A0A7J8I3P8_MOLMO|nr:HCV F-transactivated protein 1 [Molossus molossus]